MNIKQDDWLAIGIFIVIFQILCCWCIDVSVSALLTVPDALLLNGWNTANPAFTYHIGLYGIVITSCLLLLIVVHNILKKREC